ncbi:hypothetical protein KCP76_20735 [Salmonella enterica subsp. enterica serovar Weltevreden]|nr:hypothetical protein KCP76_20735 [Salmonella enterica subsp. enterica serovar Weltevreden]
MAKPLSRTLRTVTRDSVILNVCAHRCYISGAGELLHPVITGALSPLRVPLFTFVAGGVVCVGTRFKFDAQRFLLRPADVFWYRACVFAHITAVNRLYALLRRERRRYPPYRFHLVWTFRRARYWRLYRRRWQLRWVLRRAAPFRWCAALACV